MPRPTTQDYPVFYTPYINKVKEDDLLTAFDNQQKELESILSSISEENANHAYESEKWTIKEVFQHIIDAERIFSYRALCISRGDKFSFPSFDQNSYATNSFANRRTWKSIASEFLHVRLSTRDLFQSLRPEDHLIVGSANGNPVNVLSIGYIIIGHVTHHVEVVKEKYLKN